MLPFFIVVGAVAVTRLRNISYLLYSHHPPVNFTIFSVDVIKLIFSSHCLPFVFTIVPRCRSQISSRFRICCRRSRAQSGSPLIDQGYHLIFMIYDQYPRSIAQQHSIRRTAQADGRHRISFEGTTSIIEIRGVSKYLFCRVILHRSCTRGCNLTIMYN